MSIPSFAGAPLTKALIVSITFVSVLAAITSTQQYLNIPLVPHLTRDKQFFRLLTSHLAFTNSSEVFLAVLILWYSGPGVERIWGTKKLASFLVVVAALAPTISTAILLAGWRLTSGRFNTLPAGPFAVVFAIVHQSHRLVPTLYHFRLFHPALTLTNRFPLYLLALLLFTSQPPSSVLLSLVGGFSSALYTSNPAFSTFRLPPRLYSFLANTAAKAFGDPTSVKVRRGTAVTHEEAMLMAMVGASGGAGAGTGFDLAGMRGATRRRPAQPVAVPAAEAAALPEGAVPSTEGADEAVPPPMSGTTFLQQWSAGLTGSAEGPTQAQITELQNIFPHNSRPQIVAALQANGLSNRRAAEALLARGSA